MAVVEIIDGVAKDAAGFGFAEDGSVDAGRGGCGDHEERAVYVLAGEIEIGGTRYGSEQLLVLKPGDRIDVKAVSDAHVILVGGAAMDGPRHIWWNFVSSRKERIEAAKADWKAGKFDSVPGDTSEFIPLPEDR